jgi:hypothetical protein
VEEHIPSEWVGKHCDDAEGDAHTSDNPWSAMSSTRFSHQSHYPPLSPSPYSFYRCESGYWRRAC